ncbi:PAS domain S-box protein [Marinifilum caeruleilacunae]|uniref:PAS domain S-box protein n=1 Tax=Marinifilum caeruleilacunae TaxID=2499076 RepID=A0ABX1WVH1_9BACT|nr:PAS domain S-box protein [Marinifilum caeruleilacunae]NOU60101.1 PAS domain S-box protein [Marinifilum caeruleilacunae]
MKKKILIVEDDNLISTIFRMFLKELGYDLLGIVEDGKEAIRLCEKLNPDIVLMDVHLGGDLDGIQTTELIKSKFDIPVIFLSSDTEESTIQRVINTHSYGYLVKPIDKKELGISIELAFYKHQFDLDQKMREKRFRNFITDSPEAILVINEAGGIEYLNCLGLKLFKTAYIEDLMGLQLLSFIGDDYQEEFKEKFERAVQMGQGIEYTHLKFKTIHGDMFDVGLTAAHIEFNGKNNLQFIIRDVTQEYAYRDMLAEKADIINHFHDGVVTFDLNGMVKSWNKGCERIFGINEADMIGKPYSDLSLSGREKSFAEDLLIPTEKNSNYEVELLFDIDGKETYLKLYSSMLKNEKGVDKGIVCYVRDVTVRRKSQILLEESEQRNKDLINAIPDLIFVVNKDGIFEDYKLDDDSALALPKNTIVGSHLNKVFTGDSLAKVEDKIEKVLSVGFMEKFKYEMETGKGKSWFEARITNLGNDKVLVLVREMHES